MINKRQLFEWEELISAHVKMLFDRYSKIEFSYHNFEHTTKVVSRAREISAQYSLKELDCFILNTAAWFHDTGQLFTSPKYHEEKSIIIMQDFLFKQNVFASIIVDVGECIYATKIPHQPTTLVHEILCDADTFNLGTKEFRDTDDLLKKELAMRGIQSPGNWDLNTLRFLEQHVYFTSYCQRILAAGKAINIAYVKSKLENRA